MYSQRGTIATVCDCRHEEKSCSDKQGAAENEEIFHRAVRFEEEFIGEIRALRATFVTGLLTL